MTVSSRLTALRETARIRGALHRFGVRVLDSHVVPPGPPDGAGARTLIVGPDPIRILLFGSGAAIGYGVAQRGRSLDGHLAREVHERTGRGVVLENRARLHDDGPQSARESVGAAGTWTFHVVVYAPDYLSIAGHVLAAGWTAQFERVSAQVRRYPAPLVYLSYPVVGGRHLHLALIRAQVGRAHRALRAVAEEHGHVVSGQGVVTLRDPGEGMFDEAYYASCTPPLADAVMSALGIRSPAAV